MGVLRSNKVGRGMLTELLWQEPEVAASHICAFCCPYTQYHTFHVQVDGSLVSQIGPGLLCLVGISDGDTDPEAAAYM